MSNRYMLQLLKDEKEIGCHQIFGNGDYFKDFHEFLTEKSDIYTFENVSVKELTRFLTEIDNVILGLIKSQKTVLVAFDDEEYLSNSMLNFTGNVMKHAGEVAYDMREQEQTELAPERLDDMLNRPLWFEAANITKSSYLFESYAIHQWLMKENALAKGGRIFNPKLESGYELKVSYY